MHSYVDQSDAVRIGTELASSVTGSAEQAQAQLQALFEAHSQSVYRYLLRLTLGEVRLAEDLLQETMLKAWQNIHRITNEVQSMRPWLFTVARRIAIDAARVRGVRPVELGDSYLAAVPSSGDETERLIIKESVRWALNRLSREHRDVLVDVYYKGRSIAEIAAELDIPEGTVRSRTFYALRAMRASLSDSPTASSTR
jgi:RNA polymerase sigma-70 factor, ECF subfamily